MTQQIGAITIENVPLSLTSFFTAPQQGSKSRIAGISISFKEKEALKSFSNSGVWNHRQAFVTFLRYTLNSKEVVVL